MATALTKTETEKLKRLEEIVEKGLTSFIDVGSALMEIREAQLYRPNETFEEYCKKRWGLGKVYAHRLMKATEIVKDLSQRLPMGNVPDNGGSKLPENERQTRPLAELSKEEQAAAWKEATETAPNGKVTAKHVHHVVQNRASRVGQTAAVPPVVRDREPGDDSDEPGEKPDHVDDHGRSKKPRTQKPPTPRNVLKDRLGNVLPDSCRDAFADPGLTTLIDEIEGVEAMLCAESWTARAGKLTDHYGFILIEQFREHSLEALHRTQLAIEALKAGIPYSVCPKCQGIDSRSKGKTCKGCRGYGHVPEHRHEEIAKEASE